jgi:hypothetical protein
MVCLPLQISTLRADTLSSSVMDAATKDQAWWGWHWHGLGRDEGYSLDGWHRQCRILLMPVMREIDSRPAEVRGCGDIQHVFEAASEVVS